MLGFLGMGTMVKVLKHRGVVSRFGLAVRLTRLVSGRASVRYRFGSPFSSKRLWFVDTVL